MSEHIAPHEVVVGNIADILRTITFQGIVKVLLQDLKDNRKMPDGFNMNVLTDTIGALSRFEREVYRTIPKTDSSFGKVPRRNRLVDLLTIMDNVQRIGMEEAADKYDEFLGLVIDLLDEVFYAQTNRRKIHFGKYKKLFALIGTELRSDVNGAEGQVLYSKGSIYLRSAPPHTEPNIK